MARAVFIKDDSFQWMMNEFQKRFPDANKAVLKAGADIIADQMRKNLEGILSPWATGQLEEAFGISPMLQDKKFNYNVHLGFDGYQSVQYGNKTVNVPFQLLARTFESGAVVGGRFEYGLSGNRFKLKKKPKSSLEYWRKPTPFAAPAVKKTRKQAEQAMIAAAEREYQKIISESKNHK